MHIAALITWVVTALGGFYLLSTWISHGGIKQQHTGGSRFPVPVVFGHLALAAIGLVVWIAYLALDSRALAWIALILLVPVALLGFGMLRRWLPTYRARTTPTAETEGLAERHFSGSVVAAHGLLAVVTVVLVLLAALNIGGS